MNRPPLRSTLFPYTTLFRSSLRLKGDYLAIVTLGFGEIIRVLIQNTDAVGGPRGYSGIAGYTTLFWTRSEEHTSELQSRRDLVCRLLLEKKKHECVQLAPLH